MFLLCGSDELKENQSSSFVINGQSVLAVRKGGQVYTYLNRCPHRNVPLNWSQDVFLDDSASLIRCASHGALFLIETGECVAGPCEGKELHSLECQENAQGIWLDL